MLTPLSCSSPTSFPGPFPWLGGGAGKGLGIGWSRAHLTPWKPGCNKLASLHNQKCQNRVSGETVCAFRLGSAFKRWLCVVLFRYSHFNTLVPEVFLDISPHERAAREPRSGKHESRSGEKRNLWLLWTWMSLSCRRQLSNASIW